MSPLLDQYQIPNHRIKFYITLSLAFHLTLLIVMFVFSHFTARPKFLSGPVYTVNLTDMPSRGEVSPSTMVPPVTSTVKAPAPAPPKPVTPAKPKEITLPKIKEIHDIPVIKSVTPQPKIIAKAPEPVIKPQGVPGKQNQPSGPILGAVKGNSTPTGANLPGTTQPGTQGSNIPGAIEFPDPHYLQIIQTKVTENWTPPQGILGQKKELTLLVFFTINRKGQIGQIQVEDTSGSSLLDDSALRAVRLTNPLPPLPSVVKEDILRVHFQFTYTP